MRRLRVLREAAGLSQEELARLAGLSLSAIYQYERGRMAPRTISLRAIARVLAERLGADPEEIILQLLEDEEPQKLAFNLKEAAEVLSLSPNSVSKLIRSGQIRAVRVGRRVIVPRAALEEFLAKEATATLPGDR